MAFRYDQVLKLSLHPSFQLPMLFNINLAILVALAGAGLVVSQPDINNERRLARLGRVIAARQSSCTTDNDCPGSSVCCTGLVSTYAIGVPTLTFLTLGLRTR
ncbi:hypothetical protein B0H11DRAFT_2094030 [Mycena galericulata]|nr:hypothetical protein B0H11DRAFT_2094030 [Mycena galericulata]